MEVEDEASTSAALQGAFAGFSISIRAEKRTDGYA
jgi:hypothetical protein